MLFDTTQLALERASRGAAQRQQALADNIANANTPGYQRRTSTSTARSPQALGAGDAATSLDGRASRRRPTRGHVRADGNSVDIDTETAKLAENALDYQALRPGRARRASTILQTAMGVALMGLFDALDISASGLTAERLRMDVTAENLANAADHARRRTASPYRRKEVVLQEVAGAAASAPQLDGAMGAGGASPAGGVAGRRHRRATRRPRQARLRPGPPGRRRAGLRHDAERQPGHRDGRPDHAARAYEANVTAMQAGQVDVHRTLDILR